jgi:hypothetical protein
MKFHMPNGDLEIRSHPNLPYHEEIEIGTDEQVKGVTWKIFWNDVELPWFTETRLQALAIALGCQYGATQGHNHMRKK